MSSLPTTEASPVTTDESSPSGKRRRQQLFDGAHLPQLDGLRAFAVIAVLLFHFTQDLSVTNEWSLAILSVFRLGWIGVDLFFVLSGFLITSILLKLRGSISYYSNFYMRRVLRIFPLYYALIFIFFLLIPLLGKNYIGDTRDNWFWFLTHMVNWVTITDGWQNRYVIHFWTLSVEEQFYLFWPFIVAFCRRSLLAAFCVSLMILCPLLRLYIGTNFEGSGLFILCSTITRMDSLAIGGLLAIYAVSRTRSNRVRALSKYFVIISACLCALSVYVQLNSVDGLVRDLAYAFGFTCFATLFASILGFALIPGKVVILTALLSSKYLVAIGKLSYGMYMIHLPVDTMFRKIKFHPERWDLSRIEYLMLTPVYLGIAFVATLLLAILSWKILEQPFNRLKKRFPREKPATS